jgi:glycosyltransferase involved in cell wall biosynthesis
MRVAIYTETFLPKIDGIVRVSMLTLEALNRYGIDTLIVAPDQGIREYAGSRVVGVPCVRNPIYPEGRIGIPNPLTYKRVRAFRPDLMHVFHPANIGLMGVVVGRQMGVPVLSSFHLDVAHIATFYGMHLVGWFLEKTVTQGFKWSDYTLAPSRLIQDKMRAQGIPRVGLWRRGVDADLFHPSLRDEATRAELSGGHPDDTILLYVGRLAPEKQIEQVREVLRRVPGTRLALVGGGPHRPVLEEYFAGLPVTFAGYRTGESLARAYASADVFVFPSAFESFGLVLLEAMGAGIPVVSSRVGGAIDIVEEGVSGYTFDVDDVEGLVRGVAACVREPGHLHAMKTAARKRAEYYSWTTIMDELVACYYAMLEGRQPPI